MITIYKEKPNGTGQSRYIVTVYGISIGWYSERDLQSLNSWREDLIESDSLSITMPPLRGLESYFVLCKSCGKPFPWRDKGMCGVCYVMKRKAEHPEEVKALSLSETVIEERGER